MALIQDTHHIKILKNFNFPINNTLIYHIHLFIDIAEIQTDFRIKLNQKHPKLSPKWQARFVY